MYKKTLSQPIVEPQVFTLGFVVCNSTKKSYKTLESTVAVNQQLVLYCQSKGYDAIIFRLDQKTIFKALNHCAQCTSDMYQWFLLSFFQKYGTMTVNIKLENED